MATEYWALEPSEELANSILEKVVAFDSHLEETGRLTLTRRATDLYYGFDADGGWANSSAITYGGEQGETTLLRVNHFRSVVDQRVIHVTGQRPNFDAMALNTDYVSGQEARLAEHIFEYHLSRKGLESVCADAVKKAGLSGEGWVLMAWNPYGGYKYAVAPSQDPTQPEQSIYSGEPTYRSFAMYDVIRAVDRRDVNHDWLACRYDVNKWDLAAEYPEKADDIKSGKSSKRGDSGYRDRAMQRDRQEDDQVEVIEWYHKKTASLPDGRFVKLVGDTVLFDGPLPYDEICLFQISEDIEPDGCFGHTRNWDLIAPQQVLDSAVSTIVTNHDAFGIQNVLVPEGANIDSEDLGGGLRMLKYNAGMGEPKVLQLTTGGEASYKLIEFSISTIETLSGINSVARGNPEASLRTGTALALVDSKAMQANNGLMQAYTRLLESVGSALIKLYQAYAEAPHLIEIVGVDERSAVTNFTSDKISNVCRIVVSTGNNVMRTQAGRLEMATTLASQFPGQITPQEVFAILETGRLEPAYERDLAEPRYIKLENEQLSRGENPQVLYTDSHKAHIDEHMVLTFDPSIRSNEQMMQVVLGHIMKHREMEASQMAAQAGVPGPLPAPGQQPGQPRQQPPGQAPAEKPPEGPANASGGGGGQPMMPQSGPGKTRAGADGSSAV